MSSFRRPVRNRKPPPSKYPFFFVRPKTAPRTECSISLTNEQHKQQQHTDSKEDRPDRPFGKTVSDAVRPRRPTQTVTMTMTTTMKTTKKKQQQKQKRSAPVHIGIPLATGQSVSHSVSQRRAQC